ncbi:tRNA (adenosine(37)-N6)-threonylcarbamoyltransferase complex ATPase subunit type 1 TsaE [Patescibacteria group bacterium]|nr:tRNA (adenosine(37)-N6)-threonylcarbamoyltransferase complex ATPase subunit type 1 TsaE [Patescibacteria group bacterium]
MVDYHVFTTKSAKETQNLGKTTANSLLKEKESSHPSNRALILCLYGDLGSGKTTFVQGFAKGLGITSRLLSPTFIIVRRYPLEKNQFLFYHVDLYRIGTIHDLEGLGMRELLTDSFAIIVVEWAERLGTLLPKQRTDITFEIIREEERRISIKTINN